MILIFIISLLCFIFLFIIFFNLFHVDAKNIFWHGNVCYAMAWVVVFIYAKLKLRTNIIDAFQLYKFRKIYIAPVVISTLGLAIIVFLIDMATKNYPSVQDFTINDINVNNIDKTKFVFSVITIVLICPITEELLFRGVLLPSFIKRFKLKYAILFNSLLFSILHLGLIKMSYIFLLGILLCLFAVKIGSVLPSIIAHVIFNVVPFLFTNSYKDINDTSIINYLFLLVVGLALTIIGLVMLYKLQNKEHLTIAST